MVAVSNRVNLTQKGHSSWFMKYKQGFSNRQGTNVLQGRGNTESSRREHALGENDKSFSVAREQGTGAFKCID